MRYAHIIMCGCASSAHVRAIGIAHLAYINCAMLINAQLYYALEVRQAKATKCHDRAARR